MIELCQFSGERTTAILILQKTRKRDQNATKWVGHGLKAALFASRDFS